MPDDYPKNAYGADLIDEPLASWNTEQFNHEDLCRAVALLACKVGVTIAKTNRTKHGNVEIVMREGVDE